MKRDFNCQNGRKIKIVSKSKTLFFEIAEITHIECDGYLSTVYSLNSQPFVVAKLLKLFERELSDYGFLRVNKCTLVNLLHVKEYSSGKERILTLKNDIKINISRRKVFHFRS